MRERDLQRVGVGMFGKMKRSTLQLLMLGKSILYSESSHLGFVLLKVYCHAEC